MTTYKLPLWRRRRIFSATIRAIFRFALVSPALAELPWSAAFAHEVTVYSYVTDDGKRVVAPTPERPVCGLLVHGGYQEIGAPGARSQNVAAEQTRVDQLVRGALDAGGFQCPTKQALSTGLLVVCHWGCTHPYPPDSDPNEWYLEKLQMLALVGGRALNLTNSESERATILRAAGDDRYFVIVSAYDLAVYAEQKTKRLLWRTQMSVPSDGLSQEQALPLLVTAGVALFGCETTLPRRVEMNVAGQLSPTFEIR